MFHLWPVFKSLTGTWNGLICSNYYFIWLKFFPGCKNRCIWLNWAIWLNCNEASSCTKSLFLKLNNFHMLWIYFRNNHWHVRCPSMSWIVGNNRCFSFCIGLFDCFNLILWHIDSRKYKINLFGHSLNFIDVHNDNVLNGFGHRSSHLPSVTDSIFICFAGTSGTCSNNCYFKPRVIFQQWNKSLTNHTGSAKNSNIELFRHDSFSSFRVRSRNLIIVTL